jgi:Cu2+-exporting ATPase
VSPQIDTADTSLWLAKPGQMPIGFSFEEALRDDAVDVIRGLDQSHYTIEILSGDRIPAVEQIARKLSIASWQGQQTPTDKIAHIEHHKSQGRSVLMVGDGINDAPALASASVSVSPSSAADISQSTADIIFQGTQLSAIPELLRVARQSKWMAMENFSIAIAYNAVFVPLAMMGLITPLLAAVAMSSSSIGVTLNAMRILRR